MKFPAIGRRGLLWVAGAVSCLATATLGAYWYLGSPSLSSVTSLVPWLGSAEVHGIEEKPAESHAESESEAPAKHGDGREEATHSSGESGAESGHSTFDKAALQREVDALAQSAGTLRLPMHELLQSQTELAYGIAGAHERHRKAQSAIAGKIKEFGSRKLSRQDVDQLAIFVFSGGEPSVVENVLHSLDEEPPSKALLEGAIAYVSRDLERAESKLGSLDLRVLPSPVLARVLLVQSQISGSLDMAWKARLLEQAANMSLGTLVEEASVRRLVQLWGEAPNAAQMIKWSRRYLRRFKNSYYMEDFTRSFGAGVVKSARRGETLGEADILFVLKSLDKKIAAKLAMSVTQSSLEAGLKELCTAFTEAGLKALPRTLAEANSLKIYSLACRAAVEPAAALEELRTQGPAVASEESRKVLNEAQRLATSIMDEETDPAVRVPGEASVADPQLEAFAASVAQQLNASFKLLQESRK